MDLSVSGYETREGNGSGLAGEGWAWRGRAGGIWLVADVGGRPRGGLASRPAGSRLADFPRLCFRRPRRSPAPLAVAGSGDQAAERRGSSSTLSVGKLMGAPVLPGEAGGCPHPPCGLSIGNCSQMGKL